MPLIHATPPALTPLARFSDSARSFAFSATNGFNDYADLCIQRGSHDQGI